MTAAGNPTDDSLAAAGDDLRDALHWEMTLLGTVWGLSGWCAACAGCEWHGEIQRRQFDAVNDLVDHVNDIEGDL